MKFNTIGASSCEGEFDCAVLILLQAFSFKRLKTKLRAGVRDARGATAVEFALVALPLLAVVMCALQTAIIFFFEQTLQTATAQAARQVMVGSAQLSNVTQSSFKTTVCGNLPSAFSCSGVMVDVQSAKSFTSLNTTPITITYNAAGNVSNAFSYSQGGPGDIVIIRVFDNWPVFADAMGLFLANQPGGKHLMVGTAVIKNEPFS